MPNPPSVVFEAAAAHNQESLAALESYKQLGWSVVDAKRDPDDTNQLLVEFGEPSESVGGTRALKARDAKLAARAINQPTILCVHGVNHLEGSPADEKTWEEALRNSLGRWNLTPRIVWLNYNELFAASELSAFDLAKAVAWLGSSWLANGLFGGGREMVGMSAATGPRTGPADRLEWTAGMVAEWAGKPKLRAAARKLLLEAIAKTRPDLVLAHSLGSLITYDTLARVDLPADLGLDRTSVVTFGSQIGHPALRKLFGNRLVPMRAVQQWFHLFNPSDHVFTAALDLRFSPGERPNFSQLITPFDVPWDPLNHDAGRYLAHPETFGTVWRHASTVMGAVPEVLPGLPRLLTISSSKPARRKSQEMAAPYVQRNLQQRRALLVGISEYANPANNLAGCTNDVFLFSSVLQEAGFEAQNIRVVLNERATAEAIRERLAWLLDGTADGQDRVFYYAGHGAQIPGYGTGEVVDGLDECLVPYDFNWSRERAVLDDWFYELYSQLPMETRFLTVLDCCHSGGMTRDGTAKARGLNPPDDIRHRALEWAGRAGVFIDRELPASKRGDGERSCVRKLGHGSRYRNANDAEYDRLRRDFGHSGSFMPVLLQACAENEVAYEYRHGSQSNGAFTWILAQVLRAQTSKRRLTWERLVTQACRRIQALGYKQTPQLACPKAVAEARIPWGQAA